MEENNINYSNIQDAVNGYLAAIEDFANRTGDAQGLAALHAVKGKVESIIDIVIQDNNVNRVDTDIGVGIGIAAGMMFSAAAAPATLAFLGGLLVG